MSAPNELERLESRALRDNATGERVERIWRRLELELPTEARAPRRSVSVPVSALALFGAGVLALGVVVGRLSAPGPIASVSAEPPKPFVAAQRNPSHAATPTPPIVARRRSATVPRSSNVSVPEVVEVVPEPVVPQPVSSAPVPPTDAWQGLFNDGQNDAAWAALDREGGFEAVQQGATGLQLLDLSDLASAVKQQGRSLVALKAIIDRWPASGEAEIATYKLAQKLDNMGDLTGAARTYADYEQLWPDGDNAADALFNQIRIADKQGNSAQVVQLATRYAQQFPNGNDLGKVRRLRAKAEAGPSPSTSGAGELPKSSVEDLDETAPDETAPIDPAVPPQR